MSRSVHSLWMVLAMWVVSLGAFAQEAPPAQASQPKGPAMGPGDRLAELNQRIIRLVVETAQANPELKALHEAQQVKWRAAQEKRAELIAANPELKKLQAEIEEARKEQWKCARELAEKDPELMEMEKQVRELRQKIEMKRRQIAKNSPEIAAMEKEIAQMQHKLDEAVKENEEMKKLNAEVDSMWNDLAKKAAEVSPELKKALEEREALMKPAAPPLAEEQKEEKKEK